MKSIICWKKSILYQCLIAVLNALTFQEAAVDKALTTVYWLAKEEVASMKFPSLMQLLTMFGDPTFIIIGRKTPLDEGCPWLTSPANYSLSIGNSALQSLTWKGLSSINVLGKSSESDSFLGNGREEKCAAKCIKIPKNGRFRNIKFQNFPGEHAPGPP